MDEVKNLLTNGYILEINCNAGFDTKTNSIGEQCVYRTFAADGHAMTVVGYNDEIWCDINGDGIAQDAEYGAFKVANSWGPSWGNSGFIWFSYDALNESSTVPGDWENSLSGIRKSGFSYSSDSLGYNWFTYMNVQDYDVDFVCLNNITVTSPSNFTLWLKRTDVTGATSPARIGWSYSGTNCSYNRTVVLAYDYSTLSAPLEQHLSGYIWSFWYTSSAITINSSAFLDNKSNIIKAYTYNNTTAQWDCDINLSVGDVNYDGFLTTADVNLILNCILEPESYSSLQLRLADYNHDGLVSSMDARALALNIEQNGG